MRCGEAGFVHVYAAISRPSTQDRTTGLRFDLQSSGPGIFCKAHRTAMESLTCDQTDRTDDGVRALRLVLVIISLICRTRPTLLQLLIFFLWSDLAYAMLDALDNKFQYVVLQTCRDSIKSGT